MPSGLTPEQAAARGAFRAFFEARVAPFANRFDADECLPVDLIRSLGREGYLGAAVPAAYGGAEMDAPTFGLLCEECGRASASVLALLTTQAMVGRVVARFGSAAQKERWLPAIAAGETTAAFCLTEPEVGSDAGRLGTRAEPRGEGYLLNGEKTWISFGRIARLFLVVAASPQGPTAFLLERGCKGSGIEPLRSMLGFRAAMLASLRLQDCPVSGEALLGAPGSGFLQVAGLALDQGRYCVAWGCVGLSQACLEASLAYARRRSQGGAALESYQLIQRMIADMVASTGAARLLCREAARLRAGGNPEAVIAACIAKYFASTAAEKNARNAAQIHGANACSDAYPVHRYLRDARVAQIIEGSSEIHQTLIARDAFRKQA